MSEPNTVEVAIADRVALVTLNRPRVRNAMDDEMRETLRIRMAELADDDSVSVVVITGAGSAFCAGGDVRGMRHRLEAPAGEVAVHGWQRQRRTAGLIATVHGMNQVTIAAVNGPAIGLGLDLALACDFIVAAPEAAFASSFVHRGLIPDGGGLYFLPRRIGLQATKDLIFTGRQVDAAEALGSGLVDRLSGPGEAVAAAMDYASTMTGNSRSALMLMKSIVNRSSELSLEIIAALGGEAQAISYITDEHHDSVKRFLERTR